MLANLSLCGFLDSMRFNFVVRDRITSVKIANAIFDELYVTKIPKEQQKDYFTSFAFTNPVPPDWDYDTILKAPFNNSAEASNIDFSIMNTSALIIKKRLDGVFWWTTVAVVPTSRPEDFDFIIRDRYCAAGKRYEYTMVPYINDSEGRYISVMVDSEFDGLHVLDSDHIFSAYLGESLNTSKNRPTAVTIPFHSRYSIVTHNGANDYYSGSAEGVFAEYIDCELQMDDYRTYRDRVLDFLNNGRAKVLKSGDGRMYMIDVTDSPSEAPGSLPQLSVISFNWSETGNMYSGEDLYHAGLSSVSEDWNRVIANDPDNPDKGDTAPSDIWNNLANQSSSPAASSFIWGTL